MKRARDPAKETKTGESAISDDDDDEVSWVEIEAHNETIEKHKEVIQSTLRLALEYRSGVLLDAVHRFINSEPRMLGKDKIYEEKYAVRIGLDDDIGSWVFQEAAANHESGKVTNFGLNWIMDNEVTGEDYSLAELYDMKVNLDRDFGSKNK